MAPKLGEILIAGRHVSPADLKRALDAQLAYGGRLGTNLLDLGLLDEETLTRVLKEQKRVEVATPRMLEQADPKALRLISPKTADRHKAIPFALEDKKLKVAMVDPTDLIAADEVAFASGCAVIPCIAPEMRILAYLERYYGIPRPVRHGGADAAPPRAPTADQEALAPPLQEYEGGGAIALATERPASLPTGPDALMSATDRVIEEAPARASLDSTAQRLAEAETREDIGEALVAYARSEMPRVFCWLVQRDRALGWLASAESIDAKAARLWARKAQVPLGEASVIADVVTNKRYYLGELPVRPVDDALANLFGPPRAQDVVLLPVMLADQVVMVVQGDGASERLSSFDLKGLRAACAKASLALEVLLLRARIRQS